MPVYASPALRKPAGGKKRYPSAIGVERAVDILVLLADRSTASVTELAATADLSGSAVHRILTALKKKRLVEQEGTSDRYALSWGVLAIAQSLVNRDEIRELALPVMTELRDLTNETVTLHRRAGFERVCIEQVESTREIRYRAEIGRFLPLYAGASGLALLAFLSTDRLERYLNSVKPRPLTPFTLSNRASLERELEVIRSQGYAIARQDRVLGLAGLSAPVLDSSGEASAVITIAGPSERILRDAVDLWTEALIRATRDISLISSSHVSLEPPVRETTA